MATAKKTAKKTTAKKTAAKKTTKTVEAKTESVLRKGALAYVGLYGLAYERAKFRAEQLKSASGDLFENLVAKGEVIEKSGLELTKDAREKATDFVNDGVETVKNVLPVANDRVEELQAEVKALNKKIAALSKKASTPRKIVKTEKVVQAEPSKAA